ncbi:MAG: TetR family transcriptional regulator [Burkholderiaceae bacterium]|jgi:AcrR family transcriptional regulator
MSPVASTAPRARRTLLERGPARKTRARQAQDTRAALLRAAIQVFARDGFAGGRIEKISKLARSHDRMIYYYFGSKEKLFVAVLETIYAQLYEAETALSLDPSRPREALAALVRFTWRYYIEHPEFVTILISENLHRGRHARLSPNLASISANALQVLEQILSEGKRQELFKTDLTARDVYLMIASLGYFYNSNRYTLSAFLGEDLMRAASLERWEEFITDVALRATARSQSS